MGLPPLCLCQALKAASETKEVGFGTSFTFLASFSKNWKVLALLDMSVSPSVHMYEIECWRVYSCSSRLPT